MQIRLLGVFAVDVDGRDVAARPWRLRKSRTLVKVARTPVANGLALAGGAARPSAVLLGRMDPMRFASGQRLPA